MREREGERALRDWDDEREREGEQALRDWDDEGERGRASIERLGRCGRERASEH